ncbi:MAG: DUF1416 domain-containing protein [Mycobacteriales bacterium]
MTAGGGCGAPDQNASVDVGSETVISGRVVSAGTPVAAAYVRLLDASGEFTAEVPTGDGGNFRFFVKPGDWTLRALSTAGQGEQRVSAAHGLNEVDLPVA